jgi:hypothetical protein
MADNGRNQGAKLALGKAWFANALYGGSANWRFSAILRKWCPMEDEDGHHDGWIIPVELP